MRTGGERILAARFWKFIASVRTSERKWTPMSPTPAYAVQTISRRADTSGFDIKVGLVMLFLLTVALLPIW